MIGPSVTGILIAAFGGAVGLALAALASFAALALYSRLRVEAREPTGDGQHAFGQFVAGLSFIGHNFVFAASSAWRSSTRSSGSPTSRSCRSTPTSTSAPAPGFGLLNAAHGTGALVGTLTVATMAHHIRRPGVALLVTAVGMGLSLIAFAMSPTMAVAIATLLLVGFTNTFYLTQVSTFIQSNVPDQLRGRVLAVYSLCWNLPAAGRPDLRRARRRLQRPCRAAWWAACW